jgi:hypothetical protein
VSIEQGLVAHLLADSAVAAIVGTGVYPGAIPQGKDSPAIVYNRISTDRDIDMDGPSDFVRVLMQVDCWHTSYSQVKALADAVRAAINGAGIASPKLLGAESVQLVMLESDSDQHEFDGDKRDYRVSMDWTIIHLEV